MIKSIICLPLLFLSCSLFSQSYNKPESVDFDSNSGLYYISNSGEGSILSYHPASDNLDFFVTGLGVGPHGLEVVGNELFVCSGSRLLAFDLTTQEQTLDLNLNADFANGITHKGNDVFVTDFNGKDVYRYNITSGTVNMYIENINHTPNGIFYDHLEDRLLMVCWDDNAPIYEINLSDSIPSIITTTSLSNLDGITMDNNGDFYVSAWSNNAINKFNSDFSGSSTVVVPAMSSPADIYYNIDTDTLAIPNSSANSSSVVFVDFSSSSSYTCNLTGCSELSDDSGEYSNIEECQANCETMNMYENNLITSSFYPNPTKSGNMLTVSKDITHIEIYDLKGVLILKQPIDNNKRVPIPFLEQGLYVLKTNLSVEKILIN